MFQFTPFHATFGAEVTAPGQDADVNLASLPDAGIAEILEAIAKYGFLVFRDTRLDDAQHVALSRRFGDLDEISRFITPGRRMRYQHAELYDIGNMDDDGNVLGPDAILPLSGPAANNSNTTDFADSRTAFEALAPSLQQSLTQQNYVGAHCIAQSRRLGDPVFYADLDPATQPHSRHHLVQRHEPSGRMNLYAGAHLHHLEGLPLSESTALITKLNAHIGNAPFVASVPWHQPGDMIMWDNRAVQHRAGANAHSGTHKRDMRRTTVHDDSPTAWGLNATGSTLLGFLYDPRSADKRLGASTVAAGAVAV
ncbi:dichlorophenoxyacetate alpha-ketoglutarate dioxygenase [Ophiostoma piceae UAMH 11346]|uniref:Dichlorophenoxyacetate alpha-ketoglutarate dioxygenase n=1 Tax=Ophiostoma piceae (strain UAMH 11346) TaxID=1262450 RepID=S3C6Y8_OPHP1|nr:dichlorophenoxyacetate alpha-ketoglutarate dioxygenase [Ophiostoma piceae UAMH 11346]